MTFASAHRGLSGQYAENTVAAFRAAIRAGFPSLELDVRMTSDGEAVVIHDAGIDRTTDGSGRVADMRYDELRTYDTGEGPVPRLDDVMAGFQDWQGHWNIEVKAWKATTETLDILEHHAVLDRTLLSSLDPRCLRVALDRHPELPRGLIVLGPPDREDMDIARQTRCTWINADHDFLSDEVLEDLRGQGLRIGAWTVNDRDEAVALAKKGVDCIITDVVEVLEAVPGKIVL